MDPQDYFSSESLRKDLGKKTVVAGYALVVGRVLHTVLGFLSIPVLARLLDKDDFGLIAMATVFTGFANMFVDSGLSSATIQRENLTPQQSTNLFWFTSAMGLLIGAGVAALAWPVAWFYGEPRLVMILCVMALNFFGAALAMQHRALMRRTMQLWLLAAISISTQIVSILLGIGWAFWKRGTPEDYWALVLPNIVSTFLGAGLIWVFCSWRPGMPKRGAGTRELAGFGATVTGGNVLVYFINKADFLLVGWFWGKEVLGVYERAFRLLLTPMRSIASPLGTATIPALARLTDNPERYRRAFVKACRTAAAAQTPVVCLLAIYSREVVLCMLGAKWEETVPIFQWLIPAAFAHILAPPNAWVYRSWGHVGRQFRWVMISSAFVVSMYAVTLQHGVVWMAIGYSILSCLLRLPAMLFCFHGTPIRLREVREALQLPVLASAVASVFALAASLLTPQWNDFSRLGLGVAVFAPAYLGCLLATGAGRQMLSDLGLDRVLRLVRRRRKPAAEESP